MSTEDDDDHDRARFHTGGLIFDARRGIDATGGRVVRWASTPIRDAVWLRRLVGERAQPAANRDDA